MPPSSQPKRPASAHLASAPSSPQAASARAPQAAPAPPPAGPVAPPPAGPVAPLVRPAPPRPAAGRPRRPPAGRPRRRQAGVRPAPQAGPAPPTLLSAPPRCKLGSSSLWMDEFAAYTIWDSAVNAVNMDKVKEPKANWDSAAHTIYMTACVEEAHPKAAKFRYAPLAEEEKMSEVFDNCCVTNEHARVPTPSYQGDPSRIILEDDSGCESQDCQVTPIQNRGKSGKKRASPYSPSPKMNDKWAGENAKNEAFVRMVNLFSARDKRDAEESARDKREAEERAREKREPEESVDQTRQEIQHMMAMVEADGAKPGSDEHFYATFLFMEKKYRDVFSSFTAHEPIARLGWIKRMWQLNNK
ncbi:hypothetical protein D1007_29523 [Hordeum vulgare]|nr:hypothetical protein D1007_29523 [Hordeum vulgare]